MSTTTRIASETSIASIAVEDVRKPMAMMTLEISTILGAAAHLAPDFNPDSALIECSLLALNDVISAIHLQLYIGDELIREYAYLISDGPLTASGLPAEQPPLGYVPPGAHVRLVVTPNSRQPQAVRDGWFRRLGWHDSTPLRLPEGATYHTYGTFVSGGYGVSRQLLANPRFDRPIEASSPAVSSSILQYQK